MSLESGTWVDDLTTTNPMATDLRSQGDDHIRLLKTVLKSTFPRAGKAFRFPQVLSKTADYTVLATDDNTIFVVAGASATATLTLPNGLTAGDAGWRITVQHNSDTYDTVVAPPSGTISGEASLTLETRYVTVDIYWTGSAFIVTRDLAAIWAETQLSNIAQDRLLGRYSASTGLFEQIALGTGITIAGGTLEVAPKLPRGYIDGGIVTNGTDATNDIDIGAGAARDDTDSIDMTWPAFTGKQFDANWALGNNSGIRNSAAGIANTTYHLYMACKANGADPAPYAHTSADNATVLAALQAESGGADYLYLRYFFSIIRASNSLIGIVQHGDLVWRKDTIVAVNAQAVTTSVVEMALAGIPTGVRLEAIFNGMVEDLSNGEMVHFYPTDITDTAVTLSTGPGSVGIAVNTGSPTRHAVPTQRVLTDVSGQIAMLSSGSSTVTLFALGWVNKRGKDR